MEEELDYRSLVTIHDLRGICMELLDIMKELPNEGILQFLIVFTSARRLCNHLGVYVCMCVYVYVCVCMYVCL